jgi:citrate synthase
MPTGTVVDRGLEGVVVGSTDLSNVEGQIGRLTYRGYDIDDLAPNASFEEVAHLLLFGHLPTVTELEAFKRELGSRRSLPEPLLNAMQNVPKTAWPMDVLRTVVSGLALFVPVNPHGEHVSDVHSAIELIAKITTVVAAWDRIRRGLDPIEPRADLSHAANFLYMRTGKLPSSVEEDAIDTYLVLLADHSYNASTFSARVTASTRADIYASVTAAIATLTGDLHGGAANSSYTNLVANTACAIRVRNTSKRSRRSSRCKRAIRSGIRSRENSRRRASAFSPKSIPIVRSTPTSISTAPRSSPISASPATSSRASSRAGALPAGPRTFSSNCTTTA